MTVRPLTHLLVATPSIARPLTELPVRLEDRIPRGASGGPLAELIPVYVDIESRFDEDLGISFKKQTLRQYLRDSHLTSIALAIGDEPTEVFLFENGKPRPDDAGLPELFTALANDPRYVFVAHNAAFDIRGLVHWLGMPFPQHVWCSLEGAMGAWPEFPGGYSLKNLALECGFPKSLQKLEIDLTEGKHTEEEMKDYNRRDVEVMRELYLRQIAHLSAREQEIALMTHQARKWRFQIEPGRLNAMIEALDAAAESAEKIASELHLDVDEVTLALTGEHLKDIFNRDDGFLKSVRTQRLKTILETRFGVTVPTTSLKKLSPVFQAKHRKITQILEQTSRTNKMLSHRRRSAIFHGIGEVDVELGYARAHTMRFSSPSVGRGLNLHNIPKHDAAIAKPIRQIFRLPPDKCFVRGDLANVEYRIEGWLTECKTVMTMFDEKLGGNRFNDPYIKSWKSMTSIDIVKKDPIRQVSKGAVLGLGFGMSVHGYVLVLLKACSDPKSGITESSIAAMVTRLGWTRPKAETMKWIHEKTGCSDIIAIAAYHIHRLFNDAHPEFMMTAEWLVRCVSEVASCGRNAHMARRVLERMRRAEAAPNPSRLQLHIEESLGGLPSVRVQCGPWPETVCWREPALRSHVPGYSDHPRLTIVKSNGQLKPFTRQLAIENVTQAAARNALCHGLLSLKNDYGAVDVLHVHDEVLLITDRTREAVLHAREMLTTVFGPSHCHPMEWAVLIKPDEISVTESLWEDEIDIQVPKLSEKTGAMIGGDRWGRIERNEPGCLEGLP